MAEPLTPGRAMLEWASRKLLPTRMTSAELQELDRSVRVRSVFSAQTEIEEQLANIRSTVQSILEPQVDDRGVNVGFNPATAREQLRNLLKQKGYDPGSKRGTIQDLGSDQRLNLIVRTNEDVAAGLGHWIQQNDDETVDLYPALEFVRYSAAMEPRDWHTRWKAAASKAQDYKAADALNKYGRMAALKSSGIWLALGLGAGGYTDTLGNPFPPFAFNSGMWTETVRRDDAQKLGLITKEQVAVPNQLHIQEAFAV